MSKQLQHSPLQHFPLQHSPLQHSPLQQFLPLKLLLPLRLLLLRQQLPRTKARSQNVTRFELCGANASMVA